METNLSELNISILSLNIELMYFVLYDFLSNINILGSEVPWRHWGKWNQRP